MLALQYRPARTPEDFGGANALLAESGYYDPVHLEDFGGLVMLALDGTEVVGCVWVAISGTIAILDYLATDRQYPGLGVRLLLHLRKALIRASVRQVRYMIHGKNVTAFRISKALGGSTDFPYVMGCVNLEAKNG